MSNTTIQPTHTLQRLLRTYRRAIGRVGSRLGSKSASILAAWVEWYPGAARFVYLGAISLIYLSFEAYTLTWCVVQPYMRPITGATANGWQRGLFCLLASDAIVVCLLAQAQISPNFWILGAGAVHGLAIHFTWQQGLRWCKIKAGVRPSRYVDPQKPWAGLDL